MLCWIKQRADYEKFQKPSFYFRTAHFYVPALFAEEGFLLGITISKKVGNAVCRNRLRRRIKAWFRQQQELPDIKINLVARQGAGALDWIELCSQLQHIVDELKLRLQCSS